MGWLEILGVAFLVVLAVVAFYAFRFYRWLKHSAGDINELLAVQTVLPPINFILHEAPDALWRCTERLQADRRWLQQSGFVHAGDFDAVLGQVEALIALWSHPELGIACAIYECSVYLEDQDDYHVAYMAELFVRFVGGSSLTFSNNEQANTLPRPAHHALQVIDSDDLAVAFAKLKATLAEQPLVEPIGDLVSTFTHFVSDYNSWLWEEPQLRSPEVSSLIAQLGITLDDAMVERLLAYGREEKSELLSARVLQRLAAKADMTAEKWERLRERMVVVHAQMSADELIDKFYLLLGEVCEKDEARIDAIAELEHIACPVTLFSSRLSQLKSANRIKLVAKMERPVLSYVYVPKAA